MEGEALRGLLWVLCPDDDDRKGPAGCAGIITTASATGAAQHENRSMQNGPDHRACCGGPARGLVKKGASAPRLQRSLRMMCGVTRMMRSLWTSRCRTTRNRAPTKGMSMR